MVCSSCHQSRWIKIRFGKLADDLEWFTGWIPYRCHPCARRGWHRSHRTPPAFAWFTRAFRRLSLGRLSVKPLPTSAAVSTLPGGRWLTLAAAVVVVSFVAGLWMGGVLFTGPAATELESPRDLAANPAVQVDPTIESARTSVVPTAGTSNGRRPDVARNAGVESSRAVGMSAPPTRSASNAPKPLTRVVAAPKRPDGKQTTVAAKTLNSVSPPQGRTAKVLASGTAPKAAVAPALPRYHGSLAIRSEPLGALVSVDGRLVGATPLLLKGIRAGSRVVRIESQGYERWSYSARVVANQETAVTATLQRTSGQ